MPPEKNFSIVNYGNKVEFVRLFSFISGFAILLLPILKTRLYSFRFSYYLIDFVGFLGF